LNPRIPTVVVLPVAKLIRTFNFVVPSAPEHLRSARNG
jgi:hypothetical protein